MTTTAADAPVLYARAYDPAPAPRGLAELTIERALGWIPSAERLVATEPGDARRPLTHEELRTLQTLECGVCS